MGNFDEEKNIMKKFSRKGQCFSSTKSAIIPQFVDLIDDILLPGQVKTPTDGCGYIS